MMRKAGKLLLVVALFPLALAAGAAVAAGVLFGGWLCTDSLGLF